MWFAGIDWADRHHDVVVIDDAGRKVASLRVEHTAEGLKKLIAFLREIAPLDQLACILDRRGKAVCFLPFNQTCLFQTTQVIPCQAASLSLTRYGGVVRCLLLD
jgi:hypothetical protein